MKKTELKTGMIITTRDGETGIALINSTMGDIISFKESWMHLDDIDEKFNCSEYQGGDLLEIRSTNLGFSINTLLKNNYPKSIWKREERKEYTIEQLEEIVGHKIKVVDDK